MPRPAFFVSSAFALVAIGSSIYAWQLQQRLADAEAALVASAAREARFRASAMAHPPSDSRVSAPSGGEPSGGRVDAGPNAASKSGRFAPPDGRNREKPYRPTAQMRQLMAMQRKAGLEGRYAALFRQLNLNPTDLEKLKALLAQKQSTMEEVMETASEQGFNLQGNREQVQKLVQQLRSETDASIQSLLGNGAYQQFQQYEQTLPQRNVVSRLEQRMSYTTAPLYGNQAEQLVATLAANSLPQPARTGAASPFNPFEPARIPRISDAAIAQSQGFLSAPQVEALRQLQQEQAAQDRLFQQMREARQASGGSAGVTTPAR